MTGRSSFLPSRTSSVRRADNRHFQALALNLAAIFIGLFNGAIHQVGVCVTAAATEEAGPAGPALLFLHNVHMAEVLNHIFFHNTHI